MNCMYLELCFYKSRFLILFSLIPEVFFTLMYLFHTQKTHTLLLQSSMTVHHLLVSNLCYFSIPYPPLNKNTKNFFLFMDLPLLTFCNFPFSHRFL